MIKAEIIADSLNPVGDRLTTFILEYPRYVHSELMTHRVFSKNAASSRAIPIEKMIQQIQENPAMPTHWGKNQSGMQANEELSNSDIVFIDPDGYIFLSEEESMNSIACCRAQGKLDTAKEIWLEARDEAIKHVRRLDKIGLHKQIANRILEPWFHIKIILSGTAFENWFALRAHPDAHPDIKKLAEIMLQLYNSSDPRRLQEGDWHIPFGDQIDEVRVWTITGSHGLEEAKRKIAIARCARISYFNYEGKDDYSADIKLCERLFGNIPKHLSPTEHVAQAMNNSQWIGNFQGWKQFRKTFADENLSDPRVKRHL